jgi:hypothetical protein
VKKREHVSSGYDDEAAARRFNRRVAMSISRAAASLKSVPPADSQVCLASRLLYLTMGNALIQAEGAH